MAEPTPPLPSAADRPVLREAAIFCGLAFALTAAATAALWRLPAGFEPGDVDAASAAVGRVGAAVVFVPVLAALACALAFAGWRGVGRLLGRVAVVRVSPLYYLIALALPVAAQWIAVPVWSRITGGELTYPDPASFLVYWAQVTLFGAVVLLGEEIGWRGFLLPRLLARFRWRSAALVAGALWAVWHFPFWAPGYYAATGSGQETAVILLFAGLGAVALSVVITWLFIRTRYSIAIAVLLHSSGNGGMGKVGEMLGDAAAASSWHVTYNAILIAMAAVFWLLPDRPTSSSPHRAQAPEL